MPPPPPSDPPWQVLNAVTQASVAVLSVLWAAWDICAVGAHSPTDRAIEQLASIRGLQVYHHSATRASPGWRSSTRACCLLGLLTLHTLSCAFTLLPW